MKLRHFIDELGCREKLNFDLLKLNKNDSKERFYNEFFEFMVLSLAQPKKTFTKQFKGLLEHRYRYVADENLKKEIISQVFELFARMRDFFITNVEVMEHGFSFSVDPYPTNRLTAYCHLIVRREDEIEGVIFSSKKPTLSVLGRKFETSVYSSIELLGLLMYLRESYPEMPELKASFYHLRHKNDRFQNLKSFNEKDGNISTLSLTALKKKHKLSDTIDLKEYIASVFETFENHKFKKDCDSCKYKELCSIKRENSINVTPEDNVTALHPIAIIPNKAQKEILNNLEGRIGVSAVPGSGKTRVITEAIKKLIEVKKVNPNSILVLTFTNKATKELKDRIGRDDVKISSYNAFGYSLIREFHRELGFKSPPRLVTRYEQYEIIKNLLQNFELDIRYENLYHPVYGVMGDMADALDFALFNGDVRMSPLLEIEMYQYDRFSGVSKEFLKFLPLIAKSYLWELKQRNLICYEQQIDMVLELLNKNALILQRLQSEYMYVFVDEYQDTNQMQHDMVMKFAVNNLFMVGDEDQSIYQFRGARPQNFIEFLSSTKVFYLEENYRSSKAVIDFSNDFITRNESRLNKSIVCANKNHGVVATHSDNDFKNLLRDLSERYCLKDIAIIARQNKTLEKVGDLLRGEGYKVSSKRNLLTDESFLMFYTLLKCFLGVQSRMDEYVVMKYVYCTEEAHLKGNILENLASMGHNAYEKFICDQKGLPEGDIERIEKLFEIINGSRIVCDAVIELYTSQMLLSLQELQVHIEHIKLIGEKVTLPTPSEGIQLMTAHSCKGLEFKVVILYGYEDFSPKSPGEREEENRLLYVVFTRAKDELHIVHRQPERSFA